MIPLLDLINKNIKDREIKRLILSALNIANRAGESYLGIPHIILYMRMRGIISCSKAADELFNTFPDACETITTPLMRLLNKSASLEELICHIWKGDTVRLFVNTPINEIMLESSRRYIKEDSNYMLKSLGRVISPDSKILPEEGIIRSVLDGLSRESGACILLTGRSGTGKTSIIKSLQYSLAAPDAPDNLRGYSIIELAPDDEWLINKLETLAGENIIAFIDEAHSLIREGTCRRDRLKLLQPIKTLISEGRLKLILAATIGESGELLKDEPFNRRLKIVALSEASRDTAIKIARHRFGAKSDFTEKIIEEAYNLCDRWIKDEAFPGKLITVLEMALQKDTVNIESLRRAVSEKSGKSLELITGSIIEKLTGMEGFLKKKIIGQEDSIRTAVMAIYRHYLGLKADIGKPLALLFAGPTGAGRRHNIKNI